MSIFKMVSSENKNEIITFNAESSEYGKAIKEAINKGVLKISFEKNKYTSIKIWVDSLLPEYGPYYYAALKHFGEILIIGATEEDFQKKYDNSVKLKTGYFLGGFELSENDKFSHFNQNDWIDFFEATNEDEIIVLFRNFNKNEILKLVRGGAKVGVSEMKYIGLQSKYAFQFSRYEHIDI